MIVTINTDASFTSKHLRGTFAFWIVCDRFKILKSGILRKQIKRPEVAEYMAVMNALHVLSNENLSDVSCIVINTDCLNVIHSINEDKSAIKRYGLVGFHDSYHSRYKLMIMERGLSGIKIKMKHVESHTGKSDARSYVNEWCDSEAKKQMKKLLDSNK